MCSHNKIHEILLSMQNLPGAPDFRSDAGQTIKLYHDILGQWPDDVVEAAALHYRSTETFFPTAGALNTKILDLQMLAMGIPTPQEAWSQVLAAETHVPTVLCDAGLQLRLAAETNAGGEYWNAVRAYSTHQADCKECVPGGLRYVYGHPVVSETVRLLGGRERLFTDNPAADRKQFVDAYRERVEKEGRKAIMPEPVRDLIQSDRAGRLMAGVTKKLEAK